MMRASSLTQRGGNKEQHQGGFSQKRLPRRSSDGDGDERMKCPKNNKAVFHEYKKGNSSHKGVVNKNIKNKNSSLAVKAVMDALSEYNVMSSELLAAAEASDFMKIGSLSLPELTESPVAPRLIDDDDPTDDSKKINMRKSNNNKKNNSTNSNSSNNNNNNRNNDNTATQASQELTNSNTSFTPRPVRVTQFEDSDDDPDSSSTAKGRPKAVTTMTFLNSIRQHDNNNTTTGETSSNVSPALAFSVTNSSSKCNVEDLPDNVDRKGRCVRHPDVKLFKKKLLGGYELMRDMCPKCMEEAPYEDLWRGRARIRPARNPRGRSCSRGGGDVSTATGGSSQGRKGRSKEPKSRSRERRRSSSREPLDDVSFSYVPLRRPGGDVPQLPLPLTPPLKPEDANSRLGSGSSSGQGIPSPPLQQGNQQPLSLRRMSRKSPLERGRSNSRDGRGRDPRSNSWDGRGRDPKLGPSTGGASAAAEAKSLFDKGKGKLATLHQRARSSSGKRASAPPVLEDATVALSHNDASVREQGGAPGVARGVSPHSNKKSQKLKFDLKTGRCKTHPSIILARKSKFNKGWDVLRECPLCCEQSKVNSGGDDQEFAEISKKKMNAFLHGNSASFDSSPRNFVQESNKPNNECGGKGPRRHATPEPPHPRDKPHPDICPGEVSRVSRMPYTTPWGESGRYTGEVNRSGKPHGQGRMRAKNGNQIEGEWIDGYSAEFLERRGRMKSGFGTNVAEWKKKDLSDRNAPRQSLPMGRARSGSAGRVRMSAHPQSPYNLGYGQGQYYPPPPPQAGYTYGMVPPYAQSAGMWNQSPAGYQGYPTQSPGGNQGMSTLPPAYHSGYQK